MRFPCFTFPLLLSLLLQKPFSLGAAPERSTKYRYRLDAAAEGCTGVFWRIWSEERGSYITAPQAQQQNPPWPRNGEFVEGVVDANHPNFLVLEGGFALPFHDGNGRYTYLHDATAVEVASTTLPATQKFRVDSSAEGCTGLFWRLWSAKRSAYVTAPQSQQQNPPWPRNGELVEGFVDAKHPNFLILDGGFALPFHDAHGRYTYLHDVPDAARPTPTVVTAQGSEAAVGGANTSAFLPGPTPDSSIIQDVLILGSGLAGLTAAVYVARGRHTMAVVAGPVPGGAMMKSAAVENFPAAGPVPGAELLGRLVQQAWGFGARFQPGVATSLARLEDGTFSVGVGGIDAPLRSRTVVIATGATERWLNLPGEEALHGVSLHTCAYCDARFYEGKDVCVVGGGDGALDAVTMLARAGASRVTLIHRRMAWRGSPATVARLHSLAPVTLATPYAVEAWMFDQDGHLSGAQLRHVAPGPGEKHREVLCQGAFISIGRDPQTAFLPQALPRDVAGYLTTARHRMTALPGVFTAGQVADSRYQQAVTAAADGAAAAMDAMRWLDGELDAPGGTPASGVTLRGSVGVAPTLPLGSCSLSVAFIGAGLLLLAARRLCRFPPDPKTM